MIFILVTIFIDVLAIGIVIPILPELVKELVTDPDQANWYVGVIGASYALMQFLFAPVLGALSDRFGRRPVLLLAMFGLGTDFIVQGMAPNIGWLLGGRIFGGIMGASFTTANAYIADISTDNDRARNFGLVGVAFGLGFIIGPALGGLLGGYSLRWPFYVSAALALMNWFYGLLILPESLSKENRGAVSLATANPFSSLRRLMHYRIVFGLALAMFFTSLAQRGLESVWVLFTAYRYQWDPNTNGLMLGLVGLMAAIVQGGLVRHVIKRFGERQTVILGACVSCVAFLGYGMASRGYMIPVVIIFGSLGGVTRPALQSIITKTVDASEQGRIQGALTSVISLTNILAPLIFTSGLFRYFTSANAPFLLPGAPFFVGSALFLIAIGLVLRVFRAVPATAEATASN